MNLNYSPHRERLLVAFFFGIMTIGQNAQAIILSQVSAGTLHTCGLATDRTVVCWGYNNHRQATPPSGTFTQVSAGGYHTCGLATDQTVACWGRNNYGQAPPPSGPFTQVSAGGYHTCGVKTDRTVVCWGDKNYGQATPPSGTFTQVSAGNFHTCGVATDRTVACWGNNLYGQATSPSGTFTQVSAGEYYTCGVKTDGTVVCWGVYSFGQAAPPSGTFTQVSAGERHTCGLATDRTVACWGSNNQGQATPPSGTFSQVSAGHYHSCGLAMNGTVACWGYHSYGQATPPEPGRLQLTAANYTVDENAGSITLYVSRTGGSYGSVSVNYATSNGTATAGSDYGAQSGTLSWSDGNTSQQSITMTILNNKVFENPETFSVSLSNATAGAILGQPHSATVTIDDDDRTYRLDVIKSGTGNGTITSSPAGINCGSDCSESYGNSVTLTARPTSGSTFAGWGGACSGTKSCTVTMNQAQNVTATFNQAIHTLTVSKSGSGSGTVTSSPAGINCGSDCSEPYTYGNSVTLTARPIFGSTFAGWGGACSGTKSCTVTMNQAQKVTATFNIQPNSLTVSATDGGSATVNPYRDIYDQDERVTITALPDSACYAFTGWTGNHAADCTANNPVCTLTMTAAKSLTANFELQTYTLNVSASNGTVSRVPSREGYHCGQTVTLSATPNVGYRFERWDGDTSDLDGSGASVRLTMDANRQIQAQFREATSCIYSLVPTDYLQSYQAETGKITVNAPSDCQWNVSSLTNWVLITSSPTGKGQGTITYQVTQHTGTESRQGQIQIADQTVTLTQISKDCTPTITPTSRSYSAPAKTDTVTVNAPRSCPWTATTDANWINITANGEGQGFGTVSYEVFNNPSSQSRMGTLTIAGRSVTINQAGINNASVATRLSNISTRAPIEGGSLGDIVAGFIVSGTGTQQVLLRGFRLEAGVNPKLLVQKYPSGEFVAANDDWAEDSRASEVSALPAHLQLTNTTDAGLLLDLPAGAYTAILSSGNANGLGLIGIDAINDPSGVKLTNISTRAPIRGGAYDVIAGFILSGTGTQQVMIRGFGLESGVDPFLLVQTFPDATDVASNDNWQTGPNTSGIATLPAHLQLGKATDAGLLLNLPAGAYTVILSSVGAKGLGLIGVDAVE